MAGVNKVILIGNLGQDPEVKYLEGDKVVANLRLATTESYRNRAGERVENTEWHDLELWDGLAKIAEQYLKKGNQIYVEGKIKTDTWQDEQGNNRRRVRIRVLNLTMLGSRDGGDNQPRRDAMSGSTASPVTSAPPQMDTDQEEDDLPF